MKLSSQLLKRYLEIKKKNHTGFSLRHMARKLGMSPSFLSAILNGKKFLPLSRLAETGQVLELDQLALSQLKQALIDDALANKGLILEKNNPNNASKNYSPAPRALFSLLSPWYHVAIMDLTTCSNFKKNNLWIAKRLGLTSYQVEQALMRLISHGFLIETKEGYRKTKNKMRLSINKSHEDIRKYHIQMIDKAKVELMTNHSLLDFNQREISGITIASNPQNIDRARQKLVNALHEVAEILSEGECTDLFQINIQMFSLLKIKE